MSQSPSQASDISEFAAWEKSHPSNLAEENSREQSVLMADMARPERVWGDRDSSNDARSSASPSPLPELPAMKASEKESQDLGKGTDNDAPPSSQPRGDEDKVRRPAGMTEEEFKKARKAAKKARKQAARKEKVMSRKGLESIDRQEGEASAKVKKALKVKKDAKGEKSAEGGKSSTPKQGKLKQVQGKKAAKPEESAKPVESAVTEGLVKLEEVAKPKPVLQASTAVYDDRTIDVSTEVEAGEASDDEEPINTKPSRREKKAAKQSTISPHFVPKPMAVSKQVQRETQDMPKEIKKMLQKAGKAVKDAAVVVEKTVEDNAKVVKPKAKKLEKVEEGENSEPAAADREKNKKKRKRERNHNRLAEDEAKPQISQSPASQSVANATPTKSQGSKDNGETRESGRKKPRGDRGRNSKPAKQVAEVTEPVLVTEDIAANTVPDALEAEEPAQKKRRRDRGRKSKEKQPEDVEMADQPAIADSQTEVLPSEIQSSVIEESQTADPEPASQSGENEGDAGKPREKRPRPPRGQRKNVEETSKEKEGALTTTLADVEVADVKEDTVAPIDAGEKTPTSKKKNSKKGLNSDSQITVEDSQATASQVTQEIFNDVEDKEPKEDLQVDSQAIVEDSQATPSASHVIEGAGESKKSKMKKRNSEGKQNQSQSQETSGPNESQADGEPLNELADTNSKSPKGGRRLQARKAFGSQASQEASKANHS
ncbi:hypothetical protein BDZ45DRAFT_49907 [Acephala macrosclerotiorum]|nr:hypothetical protein BDZ45DRAFT_49907 [Acephala macrosclerotiorum]